VGEGLERWKGAGSLWRAPLNNEGAPSNNEGAPLC
jgi:hypothetical protein